jgi:hypothetical protein
MPTSTSFSEGSGDTSHGAVTFRTPWPALRAVVGAPYYGEHVSERVQTPADGTEIVRASERWKTWRDSLGRTRTERPMATGASAPPDVPTLIEITDPVAGYLYVLDAGRKEVHRMTAPPASPCSCSLAGDNPSRLKTKPAAPRPLVTDEALGSRTVDGFPVEGSRQTTVYPAGYARHDAPFRVISETWWSRDLQLTLLMTKDDPRSGITTSKVVNLDTQEPDPSLFVPPPDYPVVDETASFTITWGDR